MPEPFKITLADVRREGRKAYEEGRLIPQVAMQMNERHPSAKYRGINDAPCVVGAALPDDLARILDSHGPEKTAAGVQSGNYTLLGMTRNGRQLENDLFSISSEEYERLVELQSTHDAWCSYPAHSASEDNFKKELYRDD